MIKSKTPDRGLDALSAPPPLTGLPPSVAFDAIEAMHAASSGKLGLTQAGVLTVLVTMRVNTRRWRRFGRRFDSALRPALVQRGLIMLSDDGAPGVGKVTLTDAGREALPLLMVWAALSQGDEP